MRIANECWLNARQNGVAEPPVLPLIRTEGLKLKFLSSNPLPSVPEFHRLNPTALSSSTVGVADCHRRFGISPTPEHVLFTATECNPGVLYAYSRRAAATV